MVKIVIENLDRKELEVNNDSKSVLTHLHDHFVDYMHACGGKGRCTTCKIEILEGESCLSQLSGAELKYRETRELLKNERLSCQTQLSGDIVIRVPETSKLPHIRYSDDFGKD